MNKGKNNGTPSDDAVSLSFTQSDSCISDQVDNEGALLQWFPMRVTYHREERIKAALDQRGIENFLPMHYEMMDLKEGGKKRRLVPAISNLIFVRSNQKSLTLLKMTDKIFEPMRYIMKRPVMGEGKGEIMRIPDRQMENFMRVASVQDDRVMFLDCKETGRMSGKRVKIIDGYFAGVEGVIKRISRNKRVVVQMDDIAAVAIAFVPVSCLALL